MAVLRRAKPIPAEETIEEPVDDSRYKAHLQYGEDEPDWMARALYVINRWKSGTLAVCLAQALKEQYEAGKRGEDAPGLPPPPAPPKLMRRR